MRHLVEPSPHSGTWLKPQQKHAVVFGFGIRNHLCEKLNLPNPCRLFGKFAQNLLLTGVPVVFGFGIRNHVWEIESNLNFILVLCTTGTSADKDSCSFDHLKSKNPLLDESLPLLFGKFAHNSWSLAFEGKFASKYPSQTETVTMVFLPTMGVVCTGDPHNSWNVNVFPLLLDVEKNWTKHGLLESIHALQSLDSRVWTCRLWWINTPPIQKHYLKREW